MVEGHTTDNCAQPEMVSATIAKKKGHYSAQCFHKLVADDTVPLESDVTDYYDMAYNNTLGAGQTIAWNCTVLLNVHKVDTGAEVTGLFQTLKTCSNHWRMLSAIFSYQPSHARMPSVTMTEM